MGIVNRLGTVIVSKLSKIVEGMEDPREILDYSYEEQLTMLKAVKRGIVDVSASKQSLMSQRTKLNNKVDKDMNLISFSFFVDLLSKNSDDKKESYFEQ